MIFNIRFNLVVAATVGRVMFNIFMHLLAIGSVNIMDFGSLSINTFLMRYLFILLRNFDETCHECALCQWEELKLLSGSEVISTVFKTLLM